MNYTLDDLFNEVEAVTAPEDSPEVLAKREAKRVVEFERGVRLGWHDSEGNTLSGDKNDDECEDEDEGE